LYLENYKKTPEKKYDSLKQLAKALNRTEEGYKKEYRKMWEKALESYKNNNKKIIELEQDVGVGTEFLTEPEVERETAKVVESESVADDSPPGVLQNKDIHDINIEELQNMLDNETKNDEDMTDVQIELDKDERKSKQQLLNLEIAKTRINRQLKNLKQKLLETNKKIDNETDKSRLDSLKKFKNNVYRNIRTTRNNLKNLKEKMKFLNNTQKGGKDIEKEKLKKENEELKNQLLLAENILHELKNLK